MPAQQSTRRIWLLLPACCLLLGFGSAGPEPGASERDRAAQDARLLQSYRLDPLRGDPDFEAAWRTARREGDWARVRRLLEGAEGLATSDANAAARREALELADLVQAPQLRSAAEHPMRYYLSLPKHWSERQTWPIAVTVDGRPSGFEGNARTFHAARRDRPFILVTPASFSNTNTIDAKSHGAFYPEDLIQRMGRADFEERLEFDLAGLRRVLAEVRERYRGEEKVYVTGWSGGGHLAWSMVVTHADEVAGAAMAGGNFSAELVATQGVSTSQSRASLPVRAFQGTADVYLDQLVLPEWAVAKRFTEKHGFHNVRLRWLRGRSHGRFPNEILDFFESLRTGAPEAEEPPPPTPEPIRLAELDPARAQKAPQLIRVAGHPMRYWVSLPSGWERSRTWPVLVSVEGSAGSFERNARSFAEKRGDLPFIVIAPIALSNTAIATAQRYPYPAELLDSMNDGGLTARMRFDLTGLVAVLDEVQALIGGSKRAFITGYAGGGNLAWAMAFAHPERLVAAAPVSGCFWGPYEEIAPRSQRAALEVRAFQGMKTTAVMTSISDKHWSDAKSASDQLGGFASVSRVQLEDTPHGRAEDAVLAFFASKLPAEAKAPPTAAR